MNKKIPKYDFNNPQNLAFEITTMPAIYKKSKAKLIHPHRQDFYGLFYFTNSYGKHFVDFKMYDIKAGDLYFISNEQVHYFSDIEKTAGSVILFTDTFLDNDFLTTQIFENTIGKPILSLAPALQKKINLLIQQMQNTSSSTKKIKNQILKKYLEIILLEIHQNHQDQALHDNINYQRYIQFKKDLKQYYQKEKKVPFYAKRQFITPKTLNLATRQIIDKSAKQFINDYLVLLAKRMLINTQHTSAEIAFELGFEEPTNFIKFFKKNVRLPPSMFQKEQISD